MLLIEVLFVFTNFFIFYFLIKVLVNKNLRKFNFENESLDEIKVLKKNLKQEKNEALTKQEKYVLEEYKKLLKKANEEQRKKIEEIVSKFNITLSKNLKYNSQDVEQIFKILKEK